MTIEEIHNFNIDNEDIKLLKIFFILVQSQFKWKLQARNIEKTMSQEGHNKELRKITKSMCVVRN